VRHGAALLTAALAVLHVSPAGAQAAPPPPRSCAAAEYPREAVRYELEGITTLRYRLAADGRVSEVQVARSSGWTLLDDAAIRTIRSCGFTPEQAARARGAALPVQYVWSLNDGGVLRPHLVPGGCPASGRFAAFQPYENAPSGADGVKVRFLVDGAGQARGVKLEGASLPPETAAALVRYVESCRFGFDPALKGERTDTAYGRVLFR
jgi:TonB family protein